MKRWTVTCVLTGLVGVAMSLDAQQPPPNIILTNGKIKDIKPVMTMIGGRVAFDAATEPPTATR